MDLLVDNTAGHEMLSIMDGFSGYNQIKLAEEDQEKTSFTTPWGTYYVVVMPFGLTNKPSDEGVWSRFFMLLRFTLMTRFQY